MTPAPRISAVAIALGCSLLCGSLLSSGCIGVSAKRVGPGGAGTAPILRCRAFKPATDGALDDFEDGNKQLTKVAGRDGYWYQANDKFGSTIDVKIDEPGAGASEMAAHITGTTAPGKPEDQIWGVQMGNRLVHNNEAYDASKYAGISFKAKVGPSSARNVRFKIADINTHPDFKICKACWNHFGRDLTLTEQWQTYTITFSGAEQEPGWGDPRPASILPDKLAEVNWSIGPGVSYDMWFDDLTFVDCE
jgi:hypothetical protein